MSLVDTYLSVKNVIASNLRRKGVEAQGTEGLSSLAGKILQIEGGTTKILKIFTDKTVLSAADGETAYITIILLEDGEGVAGEEIAIDDGSGIVHYEETDDQGTIYLQYTAAGDGDVTLSATVDSLTSTVNIEDCIYARTSEYTLTRSSSSEVCTLIDSNLSLTLPANFSFEYDYKGALSNARFGLFDSAYYNSNRNYSLTTQLGSSDYTGVYRDTSTHGLDSGKLYTDTTTYHNCKITIENGTATWLLGGTNSASASIDWITSHNPYVIGTQTWNTGTIYVNNIKLKPI